MGKTIEITKGIAIAMCIVAIVPMVIMAASQRAIMQINTVLSDKLETEPAEVLHKVQELDEKLNAVIESLAIETQQPATQIGIGDITNSVIFADGKQKRTLTTEDVADLVGVNADTIRRRWDAGKLDDFERVDVNKWRARNEPDSSTKQAPPDG